MADCHGARGVDGVGKTRQKEVSMALKTEPDIGYLQRADKSGGAKVSNNRHECPYCKKTNFRPGEDITIGAGKERQFTKACQHCHEAIFYLLGDERGSDGKRQVTLWFRKDPFPALSVSSPEVGSGSPT